MRTLPLIPLLLLSPSVALAHGRDDTGNFLHGVLHPLGGADHVLAMVAVGLLAAQFGRAALWSMPVAFVAAMVAGGAMGAAGLALPGVEPLILASIVILGVLVAMAARLPLATTLPMIALFGAAHGWAHGTEGPGSGLAIYAAGFALSTGALHLSGIVLGWSLGTLPLRALGGGTAVAGLALAVSS